MPKVFSPIAKREREKERDHSSCGKSSYYVIIRLVVVLVVVETIVVVN